MTPVNGVSPVDVGRDEVASTLVGPESVGLVSTRMRSQESLLVQVVGI